MRLIISVLGLFAAVTVAAWLTRPGAEAFETSLKSAVDHWVATTDLDTNGDPLTTIALVGCKLRPSSCFTLLRDSIDVSADDHVLYTRFTVNAFGRTATCTGAFTRIWCDKDVLKK